MDRRAVLIASTATLAPVLAFAQQPRATVQASPRATLQVQPRLLRLTAQDRTEAYRELNTIIAAEPRADMSVEEVRFITQLSQWAVAQRNRLRFVEAVQTTRAASGSAMRAEVERWEANLNAIGDDAQLANVDLQNILQRQQQTLQMMSNISKMLYDTAQSVIRKMGG